MIFNTFFAYPHSKNSSSVNSGDLGRHAIGPFQSQIVHLPWQKTTKCSLGNIKTVCAYQCLFIFNYFYTCKDAFQNPVFTITLL